MIFDVKITNSKIDYSQKQNSLLLKLFSSKGELTEHLEEFLSKYMLDLNSTLKKIF